MPELIEVEQYRRALDPLIGVRLLSITLHDQDYARPRPTSPNVFDHVEGSVLRETRRRGKLLLLDFATPSHDDDGCSELLTVGLRFGMTGMLLIDGRGPIEQLEYASPRNDPAWDRVSLRFGVTCVSLRDQRRLGSIELEPEEDRLGPDAETLSTDTLAQIIASRRRPVKSVLLDQQLIAGIGNLLADEALWRAGLAPDRISGELDVREIDRLAAAIRETIALLTARGGSHTGDSFPHRVKGASCPECGAAMRSTTVGGRASWWCSLHQR